MKLAGIQRYGCLESKFKRIYMHCTIGMATTTITITDEAYKALKAEKKEGESFSDVILRKFQKGNPAAIRAVLKDRGANPDLADAIEKASLDLRRNFKIRKVGLKLVP